MANLSQITSPGAIRKAMAEYDRLGQNAFLKKYRYGTAYRFLLKSGNKRYDSKAILGVAFGYQHPDKGPLLPWDFSGGERTVTRRLDSLGFDIVVLNESGQEVPLHEYSVQKMASALQREAREAEKQGNFDPDSIEDARKRIRAGIIQRRGQPRFRAALLKAYNRRCAISGCNCADALEAAHIHPYRGDETNHPANGLLLRADLHTLFDLGKIAVDGASYRVIVAEELRQTDYGRFHHKKLKSLPSDPALMPNPEALNKHRQTTGL